MKSSAFGFCVAGAGASHTAGRDGVAVRINLWNFALDPVLVNFAEQGLEAGESGWFHEKRAGAEQIRLTNIVGVIGGGHHHNRNDGKCRIILQKLQQIEAVAWLHLQIGNNIRGELEFFAVGKLALALEVRDGFVAIGGELNFGGCGEALKSLPGKEPCVFLVVYDEGSISIFRRLFGGAFGKSGE